MAEIYLAGGCFWGLEEYFSRISGVLQTSVGYANGQVETTNYQLIKETDHAETVQIIYDEKAVSLREILLYYFRVIDPLSVNQQGNDRGRQYRTGIYYKDEEDLPTINTVVREQELLIGRKIAVEVEKLRHYILAEDYHQDYLKKNPGGYCHIDVRDAEKPLIDAANYEKPSQAVLREKVYQKSPTELPKRLRRKLLLAMLMTKLLRKEFMSISRLVSPSSLPRISLPQAVVGQVLAVLFPRNSFITTRT